MTKSWKWLKRILWALLGLFVLLFLAVSILVYLVNSESYLEGYITEHLGVEASVGELDVSLFSGTVNIESSIIGPKDDPYIQFESLKAELDYSELWSSRLTIQHVELNNTNLRYPFQFKLKQSDQSVDSEKSSLLFDFINVSAIDINNLDFVYNDGINLLVENANVKVRDLPVAESGFLLFEDLQRLVKASTTRVEATIGAIESDKSRLNQLQLKAYIEQEKLIVEDLVSGQSELSINLLDYSDANKTKSASSSAQNKPLDLPFSDVIVNRIKLGKTDLAIQDKEPLSIKSIEAEFSELLLIEDKKALWLNWPEFYQAQNSQFTLSSKTLQSDLVSYQSLDLEGSLQRGDFVLPKFKLVKPELRLSSDKVGASNASSTSESDIYLPFKSVILKNGQIEQASLQLGEGEQIHQVNKVDLQLTDLPLILENHPVYSSNKLTVGDNTAILSLSGAMYQGTYGQVSSINSQLSISGSDLTIKNLDVEKPAIKYALSETLDEGAGSEVNEQEKPFLLNSIQLDDFNLSGAEFEVTANKQSYQGGGIDLNLTNIPLLAESQWVVAKPNLWQAKAGMTLDASSLKLPQGEVNGLSLQSEIENKAIQVTRLGVESADLTIDVAEGSQDAAPAQKLPIDSVELQNIDFKNTSIAYRKPGSSMGASGASLKLQYLPLVKEGEFVSQPEQLMQRASNRVSFNVRQLNLPQGQIRGLVAQGVLQKQDLMLDYVTTDEADLSITLKQQDDTDDSQPLEEQSDVAPFIFRTVKVADLKLQNTNISIVQQQEGDDASTEIKNLYLGATELMLAKNFQTIEQWYGSQLENAFTLIALRIEHVQQKQNDIRDLAVTAVQSEQRVHVQPLRFTFNQTPLRADWNIDLRQQPYQSTFVSSFNDLELGKLFEPATESSVTMSGQLDGDINLRFEGLTRDSIFSSIDGSLLVKNQTPITIHRLNVNKILRSFLDSQKFGLLDIGGFLLAGPLGLLASQGVSLQDTVSQLGADEGDTLISALHVEMTLKDGLLQTKDVAAATRKYRFAFNGQINLAKQEFNDFEFDVINEKGCSEYGQTLNGSLSSPEIETFTAAFDAVTGSVIGLIKQGVGLLTGGACSSVYEGVVPHPKEGAEIIPREQRQIMNENQGEIEDEPTLEELE